MKTTRNLTIVKLYDFAREPWTAHGSSFVTIGGEAVDEDGNTFYVFSNTKEENADQREADLASFVECEAQFFVLDEGKLTKGGMPKLKILGYPGGPGEDSQGLDRLGTSTVAARQTGGASGGVAPLPPANLGGAVAEAEELLDRLRSLVARAEQGLQPDTPEGGGEDRGEGSPPPDGFDDGSLADAWAAAVETFGNEGKVLLAYKRQFDKPPVKDAITADELRTLIERAD